jgi:hypothetical protein
LETISKRVVSGSATADTAEAHSFIYYLERVHICAVIFAVVFLGFKYLLHLILYSFHATTFGQRIHISNQDTRLLAQIYKAVRTEEMQFVYHLRSDLILNNEHQAVTIAKALFQRLKSATGESLTLPDLEALGDLQDDAYNLLKGTDDILSEGDFIASISNIYRERENILKSQKSNRHIMHKLDRMLTVIATVLSALLSTPFLDFGVTTLWAGVLALFAALGFALQSVGRTSFEAFLFIFVVHSFDIGDVVVIEGEQYLVEHLEVFSSTFRKVDDGNIVYAPNSALSSKNITNISRTEREKRLLSRT